MELPSLRILSIQRQQQKEGKSEIHLPYPNHVSRQEHLAPTVRPSKPDPIGYKILNTTTRHEKHKARSSGAPTEMKPPMLQQIIETMRALQQANEDYRQE